jgi:hypothetical protein
MVDFIASIKGTEAEVHVFCPDCFWVRTSLLSGLSRSSKST